VAIAPALPAPVSNIRLSYPRMGTLVMLPTEVSVSGAANRFEFVGFGGGFVDQPEGKTNNVCIRIGITVKGEPGLV